MRPGRLARDYVEGKRQTNYGPFASLATLVALSALFLQATGFRVLANDGIAEGPSRFLEQHFNVLLLAQLPLTGAVAMAVFRRERLTFAEHMALVGYALSVRAFVLLVLAVAAWCFSRPAPTPAQTIAFWIAWYVYFGWVASQFYEGPRAMSWLKGTLAAVVSHALLVAGVFGLAAAFARFA